jgi:hypothetical protein
MSGPELSGGGGGGNTFVQRVRDGAEALRLVEWLRVGEG